MWELKTWWGNQNIKSDGQKRISVPITWYIGLDGKKHYKDGGKEIEELFYKML